MKNFVKGMITNRFGIVLTTLNLCYLLSNSYVYSGYVHTGFTKIMIMINSPALLLAIGSSKIAGEMFQDMRTYGGGRFSIILMVFFVTLQWLFIAHLARIIALKIRPNKV